MNLRVRTAMIHAISGDGGAAGSRCVLTMHGATPRRIAIAPARGQTLQIFVGDVRPFQTWRRRLNRAPLAAPEASGRETPVESRNPWHQDTGLFLHESLYSAVLVSRLPTPRGPHRRGNAAVAGPSPTS